MNAPKISHTVAFENPDSAQRIASAGHRGPAFASCSGEKYTWLASTRTVVTPSRPMAPPGRGSSIRATTTPAKMAKYHHACCASPSGGATRARPIAMTIGTSALHETLIGCILSSANVHGGHARARYVGTAAPGPPPGYC